MKNYVLPKDLRTTFKDNAWWTFMGKYFGFPHCCIKNFCESGEKSVSLFDGTGYVPCGCCNNKINDQNAVQEFTNTINLNRYHNKKFGMDDTPEDNPNFFTIMENFYIANKAFPYEDMLYRGGQKYLYEKFLNREFSFFIYAANKLTKEETAIDLAKELSNQSFFWLFNALTEGNLTKDKKDMILEDLNLSETHTIHHKKTKQSINDYFKDIELLLEFCFDYFRNTIQQKTTNTSKKLSI